ncbi:MAG: GGDEF domain-containing protein, partial [Oscillospiraceae bacterium]|nr:GGDEF domain-containing protein [Oscillospiraceae bacterium]
MQPIMITERITKRTDFETVSEILYRRCIRSVYQPIVSLKDGKIFGYEALSRITNIEFMMNIGQMFRAADRVNRAWELEALCREKALEGAVDIEPGKKLFINVNPNIINDPSFRSGFTKRRLEKCGLNFEDITFEITEHAAITDLGAFLASINYYKGQNYGIALDDVGSGFSRLNIISDVRPNFIKIDINLVRNIDKDEIKRFLCKAMIDFCKSAKIKVIAEGIETEEELEILMQLGADYGQGYFLGIPRSGFEAIAPEKVEFIKGHYTKKFNEKSRNSIYPKIGVLSKPGYCFAPDEKAGVIYETMRLNPLISEFTIVENDIAQGFITRTAFNEVLGGRYGFSLYSKKPLCEIVNEDFLRVNGDMTADSVSRLAMQRPFDRLYDPIVIENDGKYIGLVSIKDLLDVCTRTEIDIAIHASPLTGLPGNVLIEQEILSRVFGSNPYCITYYDIDNFKAYNDAYGFQNGDLMISLVADILRKCATKNEFVGHIGGDDFIV